MGHSLDMGRLVLGFCTGILLWAGSAGAAGQLPNLNDEKPPVRFAMADRTWPANPGDADICLWKDDRIAAVSFTVDDNIAPDVPWWLEMADKFGIRITWFIISKNVGGNGVGGTWDLWKQVLAKGHDVQSHTHTHLHTEEPGWKDIGWEYAESKRVIEENLPGHRVRFLAYPGGPNSHLNDRSLAAQTYAGARGVTGTLSPVNQIDYLGMRAVTESSFGNPKANWADAKRVLDPADKMFRTWVVFIYHGVKDKTPDRPLFQYLAENKDKFWFASYADAALYGQQRDTATLKVVENSGSKIVFTVEDRMDDATFDFPLTVKVRLPSGWTAAAAEQAGKATGASTVEHEGNHYVLVDAVPDRGPVTLVSK